MATDALGGATLGDGVAAGALGEAVAGGDEEPFGEDEAAVLGLTVVVGVAQAVRNAAATRSPAVNASARAPAAAGLRPPRGTDRLDRRWFRRPA